jgi:hypothetical protein
MSARVLIGDTLSKSDFMLTSRKSNLSPTAMKKLPESAIFSCLWGMKKTFASRSGAKIQEKKKGKRKRKEEKRKRESLNTGIMRKQGLFVGRRGRKGQERRKRKEEGEGERREGKEKGGESSLAQGIL